MMKEVSDSNNKNSQNHQHAVVLFDGVCNFCNGSVQFIIRRDPQGFFQFAALQSETARRLQADWKLSPLQSDSILLFENGQLYDSSTAALRIARRLRGWPKPASIFIYMPALVRDPIYRWIARNRYKWFGKQEACMLPSPEIRGRFLND